MASTMHPPELETTCDAFHRGRFYLIQPANGAHRSGIDATLLASSVPEGFSGNLADLGSGAGAAALSVLDRSPDARATLYDKSPAMVACARQTMAHPGNAHLCERAEVFEADVSVDGKAREQAGFPRDRFDWVITNPPFNDPRDRATPKADRASAHVMQADLFERWIKTACAISRPGGGFSVIARPQAVTAILDALKGRYGGAVVFPVHPRPSKPAIRIIVTAIKGSRRALEIAPPLMLHEEGKGTAFTEIADAVTNGRSTLRL